jgi:hypothetical protein
MIVGPAAMLEQSLALESGETFDAAVSDYNLPVFPASRWRSCCGEELSEGD